MGVVIPIRKPIVNEEDTALNVAIGFLVWVIFPMMCFLGVYLTVEAFAWLIRHLWVFGTFGSV